MPLPRWVRRIVLPPATVLLALLVFTSSPLLLLGAAAASPLLPGRLRPLRVLLFVLVYLALEAILLVVLGLLWVAAGMGRRLHSPVMQRTHYRLAGWFLRIVMRTARRAFNLQVVVDRPLDPPGERVPLIVLARHAGPGDSFLLIHELLNVQRRRPRIVLREALQWDPCIDVALNRLPTRFIPAHPTPGGDVVTSIAELAAGMGPDDALVIFPEGANFTEPRRLRSIAKLEELGRHDEARGARALQHLLAPRLGGVRAALTGCPNADVVFVGHTGLEDLSTIVDLWRGLPMDEQIHVQEWRVAAPDVPREANEQGAWLRAWWQRIDDWVAARRPAAVASVAPAGAGAPAPPRRGREPRRLAGAIVLAGLLAGFALANRQYVAVDYLVTTRDSRLVVVIITSAVLGVIAARLLQRRGRD